MPCTSLPLSLFRMSPSFDLCFPSSTLDHHLPPISACPKLTHFPRVGPMPPHSVMHLPIFNCILSPQYNSSIFPALNLCSFNQWCFSVPYLFSFCLFKISCLYNLSFPLDYKLLKSGCHTLLIYISQHVLYLGVLNHCMYACDQRLHVRIGP